jgi:predicted dienelactone hydrolase
VAALRVSFAALALVIAAPAHAGSVERWRPHIEEASARFGVPAEWIERVEDGRRWAGARSSAAPARWG